jgi:hypothetical protein
VNRHESPAVTFRPNARLELHCARGLGARAGARRFELLDDLREVICARYLPDMQQILHEDRRQRELPFNERDLPF